MRPPDESARCGLETCVLGSALDGMCVGLVLTSAAGRVSWLNRTARRTLGLLDHDVEGQPLAQLLRDPQMAAFWHRALGSDGTLMADVTCRYPGDAELKANATTSLSREGELIGRVLLFCDVTRERAVQVKLSEAATLRLLDIADSWQEAGGEPIAGLTPTELRVLRLVGTGMGNQEIADRMHVAPSTVRTHLKQVYRKTGLSGRSEAIHFALQHGLA